MHYRVVTWRLVGLLEALSCSNMALVGLLDVLSCSNMAACRVIGSIIV